MGRIQINKFIPLLGICLSSLLLSACSSVGEPADMLLWETPEGEKVSVSEGTILLSPESSLCFAGPGSRKGFQNFILETEVRTDTNSCAGIVFHTDNTGKGYEVLLAGGPADGSRKTGSLSNIRNLYRTAAPDGEWFPLTITVRGKNIAISVNGTEVVCYTEPSDAYRLPEHAGQRLSEGNFTLRGYQGETALRAMRITRLAEDAVNPQDTLGAKPEHDDRIIRLQQQNFPVIDYHVHLKGWNKEEAHARSMYNGINYGIAPNCGIGFPITNDAEVAAYRDSTRSMPFFFGMQGEGREWVSTFSESSRKMFDYVFTDALTFTDHKGRRTRLWIPEEVFIDIPEEEYMDLIVDKIVQVVQEEPIDIYVNPCMLPDVMNPRYNTLWTAERRSRVIEALKQRNIALEINARYRIPNFTIIREAKAAGLKFTFGTNNATPDLGELEYCMEAIDSCGLTVEDMWFPTRH